MPLTQRVESVTHLKTCDAKLCEMLIRQACTMNNSSWNAARTGLYSSSVLRSIYSLHAVAETRWLSAPRRRIQNAYPLHAAAYWSCCARRIWQRGSPTAAVPNAALLCPAPTVIIFEQKKAVSHKIQGNLHAV